jgi:GT2 family glycosyltransferase
MPVSAIVVNWKRCSETLACVSSLARSTYPSLRVVVIDNASNDGSVDAIRRAHPSVDLIAAAENLGFVGGCNVGVDRARQHGAGYVLFLNNDAEIAPDAIALLVAVLQADVRGGAAGPTILYHDRPDVIWSAGGRIDWQRGTTTMLELDEPDRGQCGTQARPVDFVSGCALMAPLAVIDRVGGFDPRFFAYYEETEWCVRATRAGYTVLQVPLAKAWHKAAPSTQPASLLTHYYMTRNRLLFLAITHAGIRAWCHTLLSEYLRTVVSWTVRPKWRSRRHHRAVMLRAIADYLRGRLGRAEWVEHL